MGLDTNQEGSTEEAVQEGSAEEAVYSFSYVPLCRCVGFVPNVDITAHRDVLYPEITPQPVPFQKSVTYIV